MASIFSCSVPCMLRISSAWRSISAAFSSILRVRSASLDVEESELDEEVPLCGRLHPHVIDNSASSNSSGQRTRLACMEASLRPRFSADSLPRANLRTCYTARKEIHDEEKAALSGIWVGAHRRQFPGEHDRLDLHQQLLRRLANPQPRLFVP